jgi:hypothetical protein
VSFPETDKQFHAVIRHYTRGLLRIDFFDDSTMAHNWLMHRWAELPSDQSVNIDYGGAIYGTRNGNKILLILGASYLVKDYSP